MFEFEDEIALYIDGARVSNYVRYSFTRGIFEQPSSFSVTVGSGTVARELLQRFKPLAHAELKLGSTKLFDGVLEDPISSDANGATEITIQGRDQLYQLTKSYIRDERSFGTPTYFELTKEILKLAGMDPSKLVAGNEANRRAITKIKGDAKPKRFIVENAKTGLLSASGTPITYEKIVGQIGESCFDFLTQHYKKCGLYLWCGADGSPILSQPDWDMSPIYGLKRERGISKMVGSIKSHTFTNRTSGRHAWVRCYGKGKPDKDGQFPVFGDWHDQEMLDMGFPDTDCLILHSDTARNEKECSYVAKRHIAGERRQNRTLTYTVRGHVARSLMNQSESAIWAPDTMVRVDDDEIGFPGASTQGIHENMYVEKVTLDRDARNGTTATLNLLRKIDLLYLGEDPASEGKVPRSL